MLNPKFLQIFDPYLDYSPEKRNLDADQRGLVSNAPPEAVEAYKHYQEIMKKAKENDIEV